MECLIGDGLGSVKRGGGTRLFTGNVFRGIASRDFLDLKGHKGKVFNGVASKGPGMQLL
jgi:hypothetical protein